MLRDNIAETLSKKEKEGAGGGGAGAVWGSFYRTHTKFASTELSSV
jgi:hypothetical protein